MIAETAQHASQLWRETDDFQQQMLLNIVKKTTALIEKNSETLQQTLHDERQHQARCTARGYTESAIRQRVCAALERENELHMFYCERFLNYRGNTTDSQKPYIEVIAKELLEHYEKATRIGQGMRIRRTKNFNVSHDGISNVDARLKRFGELRFSEKLLAVALYNSQTSYCFGRIFDYQVPLKERQADKFGEIDLVALQGDSIKLLELKISGKTEESLLRALLEVYTYYKLLANSKDKFVTDFSLQQPGIQYFQPGILTERNSLSGEMIMKIDRYPYMKDLLAKMSEEIGIPIELFVYDYPSREVQFRNETDKHIDLVGDICIEQITIAPM